MVGILPFMEQGPLYDTMDFNVDFREADGTTPVPENVAAAKAIIAPYLCPSDTNNGRGQLNGRANAPSASEVYGVSNYKAVAGSNWFAPFANSCATCKRNPNTGDGINAGNGFICRRTGGTSLTTAMADISDGTSNTFAVGEVLPSFCNHSWWYNPNANTGTCGVPLNHYAPPQNPVIAVGTWPENYSFASEHRGGGQFCLADGGVRFISENIDFVLYRSLATISGGEAASVP